MKDDWDLLLKLAPELSDLAQNRHRVLANIYFYQPVGRRALAELLGVKERQLRNEISVLKDEQLIQVESYGMVLTALGKSVLHKGRQLVKNISGLVDLESELKAQLNLERVVVVPGDSSQDNAVKQELGTEAAKTLWSLAENKKVISVAGGTTLACMADMAPIKTKGQGLTIVPARGGLGERVEIQANNVAAELAKKFNCSYRMLHVPDAIREEFLQTLLQEPKIQEIVSLIKNADILVHGIGRAAEMAKRRGLSDSHVDSLLEKGALAEAFGFYLNRSGHVIEKASTVGIGFEDLEQIGQVVALAGGSDKADAIMAMLETGYNDILITDEGAGRKITSLI